MFPAGVCTCTEIVWFGYSISFLSLLIMVADSSGQLHTVGLYAGCVGIWGGVIEGPCPLVFILTSSTVLEATSFPFFLTLFHFRAVYLFS